MPTDRPAADLLRTPYLRLKALVGDDYGSQAAAEQVLALVRVSLTFLVQWATRVDLVSRVPGKQYISYALISDPGKLSSPINVALFNPDVAAIESLWKAWNGVDAIPGLGVLTYTMASAFRAASELFDRANKKGPATYFEFLVGHLVARAIGVNPRKRKVQLPVGIHQARMTMDFLIDLEGGPHIQLPVKFSTRERVVQAWAHQRLLDSAFGHASYRAILIIGSETKLAITTREVTEICVPDQWLAYQVHLARMDRIYYFDMPARYARLTAEHPVIPIKQFAEFFTEREAVLSSPLA